jgi:hypothetical protein
VVAKHPVNAEPCDRIAKPIQKDGLVGRTVANKGEQCVDGRRPERAPSHLASLTSQLHVAELVGMHVQVADQQRCGFADASPGVLKEQQECVITAPLLGAAVGSRQDGILREPEGGERAATFEEAQHRCRLYEVHLAIAYGLDEGAEADGLDAESYAK